MATPRKPRAKKDTRVITEIAPILVQPGAVGMILAAGDTGQPIRSEVNDDPKELTEDQQVKRDAFMSTMRLRWKESSEAENQLRQDMLEDLEFYNSDQWPDAIKMARTLDDRPCLTINRLPQFVRQVVNQGRQSRPSIQVNPVDNIADPKTAEVIQGIIRSIERQSKAHIAYSTAMEHQAIMGRGWWRILAEYAADDSFEQEIRIRRIMDSFTVYPDPSCNEPDYSDANYCFIIERIPKHEYVMRYGEEAASTASEFQSIGDQAPIWMGSGWIQVAEYYYVERTKVRIADCLVDPGTDKQVRITIPRSTITAEQLAINPATNKPNVMILKERDTLMKQVKWALVNGVEVLEGNPDHTAGRDIPGRYIPVVPVLGEELVVNGRKNLRGMVRDAKDPQRAYNFWVSAETEMIALAPRAPVIGALGMFEGLEDKWNQANKRNFAYLEYNPIDINGTPIAAPQRAAFDPNVGPIIQATLQADRDLKSVIGMFDASQEGSPEQSGKAIIARQRQGEEGTSHFLDNLSRSIEHTGRILVDWIPVYYDKPRMLKINGLDEKPKDVLVHAGQGDAAQDMLDELTSGDKAIAENIMSGRPFDLGVGRYDVSISVGPSYASRRQESVEALIQLVQAYPAFLPVCGDILTKNMDWPGAQELSERLKRMVPPEAQEPKEGEQTIPPEIQQQMAQMQQQLEAAMAALAEKDEIINTKAQELAAKGQIEMAKMESAERLAAIKAETDVALASMQIDADKSKTLFLGKLQEIKQRLDIMSKERQQLTAASLKPPPPRSGGRGGAPGKYGKAKKPPSSQARA